MKMEVSFYNGAPVRWEEKGGSLQITVPKSTESTGIRIRCPVDFEADGSEYLFLPACCYDGNRFASLKKEYPPIFTPQEASPSMPVTVTDVIRLQPDGGGRVEVTTGDVSTPCIGLYSRSRGQAALLFTVQEVGGANLGLAYEKGSLELQYPHYRQGKIYRAFCMREESDPGRSFAAGETLEIPYKLLRFPCRSMEEFYQVYFENRKCMGLDAALPERLPFSRQLAVQREKYNRVNWREPERFYMVGEGEGRFDAWQPGWVGGAMSSYALMKLGGELEWQRGMDTLRFLFSTQRESGFFCGVVTSAGEQLGDAFGMPGAERWHLIRKSADVLLFLFKHFTLIQEWGKEVPTEFAEGAKRLADAFVRLWETSRQLGQFVDELTGEIAAGGSTSGSTAPAGLVGACRFFGEKRYLATAEEIAEQYYFRDAANGYTTGGPGEILQCPDSESAFGLLESMTALYGETGDEKWLRCARHVANLCASWVVSYNYRFPEGSELGRLGMKTVGSVFANVQNKHSAPGICTLSGDSLYRLWKWTGDSRYLELLQEIALTISQYMSRDDRPIYSWDAPPQRLPQGYMCERVNLSDWEGERCVGGVFPGSCWCECSNLLTMAEVIGLEGVLRD